MCFSALIKRDMKYFESEFGATWVRESIERFETRSANDPKRFSPLKDRIFQGSYAPVLHLDYSGNLGISPMRYGTYEPSFITNPKLKRAFNARRDNLESPYWTNAYRIHHGFVVLNGFYEWVPVKKLITAGVVSMPQVKAQFEKEIADRKERVLAQGKKYALTKTEKIEPIFRDITIQFKPSDHSDLFVPVIFTERILEDGMVDQGFAIVTDDPQHEVLTTGHDRSPCFVVKSALQEWIDTQPRIYGDFPQILDRKPSKYFEHQLLLAG